MRATTAPTVRGYNFSNGWKLSVRFFQPLENKLLVGSSDFQGLETRCASVVKFFPPTSTNRSSDKAAIGSPHSKALRAKSIFVVAAADEFAQVGGGRDEGFIGPDAERVEQVEDAAGADVGVLPFGVVFEGLDSGGEVVEEFVF